MGVIATKGYSTLPKVSELGPHNNTNFHGGVGRFTPLQGIRSGFSWRGSYSTAEDTVRLFLVRGGLTPLQGIQSVFSFRGEGFLLHCIGYSQHVLGGEGSLHWREYSEYFLCTGVLPLCWRYSQYFLSRMGVQLYDRKWSLLIYRTHKIMIATSTHESIHRMLSIVRLSSKWKRGFCA